MTYSLNIEEQTTLLVLARNSIKSYLNNSPLAEISYTSEKLEQENGIFVTLTIAGSLRGCIGNIIGQYPLKQGVQKMAIQAAFRDPRFHPLSLSELDRIHIEISVLSPLYNISVEDIKVGKHGLLIKNGSHSGVLLPQVPIEQNWNKQQYLDGICRKAGLTSTAITDPKTNISAFTAFVFSEGPK